MRILLTLIAAWVALNSWQCGTAQDNPERPPESKPPESKPPESNPLNVPTKTLGGRQWWTDQLVFGDWRIQQNSETGHCRLLDERDVRRAWGSYEQCLTEFERERKEQSLTMPRGRVVVMLHGLMGTRQLMDPLKAHLRKSGYTVMSMSYASTRASIDDHAQALGKIIGYWGTSVDQIDFVGHSMGNIVIRRYLHDLREVLPRLNA